MIRISFFCPALLRGTREAGGTCSQRQAVHFLEEPEKTSRLPVFWGGTGNAEGRAAEAEERRAASAQEGLTACRARKRVGRKRVCQNRFCACRSTIAERTPSDDRKTRSWLPRTPTMQFDNGNVDKQGKGRQA